VSTGPAPQDNFSVFQERYAETQSDVTLRIEQEVFGHSSGCERVISAWLTHEAELRELKGDEVFEEEQGENEGTRRGILMGLLKRGLIVARK
jgi:hypothetical protein